MPNKISLEEVKLKLPSFVKIIDETYKGVRYNAEFIDTGYDNEKFIAIVGSVITLQHGCKSRSNKLRSKTCLKRGSREKTSIEEIKLNLPSHLEIDESSYTCKRNKAWFYDKEYDKWFESLVCNVLRTQKGYCKERQKNEFIKAVKRPIEDVEKAINDICKGELVLIPESYIDTNSTAKFKKKDGTILSITVYNVLKGLYGEASIQYKHWREKVITKFNSCQICNKVENLETHHLYGWKNYPDLRFEVKNGLTLCFEHHTEFHSKYGKNTVLSQFIEFIEKRNGNFEKLLNHLKSLEF